MLRTGRQVGKSTVIAQKACKYSIENREKVVLVIASVERQAQLLFEKILSDMELYHPKEIKQGKDRPTKHLIKLKNGSRIYCLPTGLTGHGIRGYTVDLLIADEAAFIPEEVWTAVSPMLAVTKGDKILLSTPFGRGGYFYDCFSDPSFTSFHITSEECPRIPQEFLAREKKRMSQLQYAQEYLGEFVDELRQFFPTKLIEKCMKARTSSPIRNSSYYCGVDIARLGGDENVIATVQLLEEGRILMTDMMVSRFDRVTETFEHILKHDNRWQYKKIYVDDGGIGGAVFDLLHKNTKTRRKVVGINNAKRSIDFEGRAKKLMKEDIYNNLLSLMENDKIRFLINDDLALSLKSVQYEYTDDGRIKIFGNYTHIAEALVRAAWCVRDKGLNIWITSKKYG